MGRKERQAVLISNPGWLLALAVFEKSIHSSPAKWAMQKSDICLIFAQPIVSRCVFPGALALGES